MTETHHRAPVTIVADGLRRVWHAPAILVSVWLVTSLVALRPAAVLYRAILNDLGSSMAASTAVSAVNATWWQEFMARQPALAQTFQPFIIGFAAVLANVSMFLSASTPGPMFAAPFVAYVMIWTFLLGGILDRYARQRRLGAHGFFAAGGVFFFRFLRLGVLALMAWTVVFGALHRWIFHGFYGWVTRESTVERTAFLWHAVLTVAFVLVAAAVMVVFDYAKVRAVVEDRRSMLGALLAGARFVRRHASAAAAVFALNALLFAAAVAAYALLARGAIGGDGVTITLGLIVAQIYVLGRLFVKLSFYASAVALFQDRLAHARYTAVAPAVWPESPQIETITDAPPRT